MVGRPHPEWGETVVAHVVRLEGSGVDGPGLRAYLSDRLAKYTIPREFAFTDDLPRTPPASSKSTCSAPRSDSPVPSRRKDVS